MCFIHPDDQLMLLNAQHGELVTRVELARLVREAQRTHPTRRHALSARPAAALHKLRQLRHQTHEVARSIDDDSIEHGLPHRNGAAARVRARKNVRNQVPRTRAKRWPRARRSGLPNRLLGVWAHPDDEAYLSAGLMGRVIDAGGRVTVVTATSGENGMADPTRLGTDEFGALRRAELTASLAELGVTDVRFLGIADGGCELADHDAMASRLLRVIDEMQPDMIITFGPDGITGHPDHRAVSHWTTEACHRGTHDTELLYAVMTEEFLDRHALLHERLGLFDDYGRRPVAIPSSAVSLSCSLSPRELERKRRALARHASQTAQLAVAVGEDAYLHWWQEETFRRPTDADRVRPSAARAERVVIP